MNCNTQIGLNIIALTVLLSGCSSITDTIAASSQTFTNVSDSSSGSSTNMSKDSSPSASNTHQAIAFAKINWMNLSANMSQGKGEHLAAIADLLEVKVIQRPAFYRMTQKKFMTLFNEGQATPVELIAQLQLEIKKL
ncbi:MAG: DUF3015 family protein [Methylococcales bacterium]|nr:DUF3015 family protein [Methylococcales bacterium]